MYSLLRSFLFEMEAERSHDFVMNALRLASKNRQALSALSKHYADKIPERPLKLMGLDLKHPIGLAAGLDKQGVAGNALSALGFAWVEYGTVTPLPQAGNEKPRMFRLPEHQALINRMGFNSIGLEAFLKNIQSTQPNLIKGLNIGKNAATPIEKANEDYIAGMRAVYPMADYVCVNISSPNTKDLRELQSDESLDSLLSAVSETRKSLEDQHGFHRPIVLKVAPDLDIEQIDHLAKALLKFKIDGLAATNTTLSRISVEGHKYAEEAGGLSGAPIQERATECIAAFRQRLQGEVVIIGSGGIHDVNSAKAKLDAGADALQLYTGFIYHGPALIKEIVTSI
ncbi:MAG: dihydroorotate dehydrogenase [Gammaproteobacteria bacterium]|jgi:dihydroorotate dehydrogenase